ncbi:MAG TPA: IS21 family transposase [Syntrophobacteraceae bacterium]|nr:IS21 family transposase [Syntrophobacteraceae bacterium]
MLSKEDWMEIKAQAEKGVYLKDIAQELGVHPKTVSRALQREGAPSGRRPATRGSKLDPFKPFVDELLRDGVWNATVILRELESRGYSGGVTVVRNYVHPKRSLREGRATVRFETEPGKQLQSDWGEISTSVGSELKKVCFIVNTLGFSRRFHFWCTESMDAEHTYEGMKRSFEYFGGGTEEVLVDNQKAAVISHRMGESVRYNERFVDFAGHYGFHPRACRPYRARTKGKDERMVGYIKGNFFQRYREFESLSHMNELALSWLASEADPRLHGTVKEVVMERFERERPQLKPLPAVPYDTSYLEHRMVHWDGFIDVRGNRYSVPAELCGKMVQIRIGLDQRLRVYVGETLAAEHQLRSAAQGWVTVTSHHSGLWQQAIQVERRDLSVYEEAGQWN